MRKLIHLILLNFSLFNCDAQSNTKIIEHVNNSPIIQGNSNTISIINGTITYRSQPQKYNKLILSEISKLSNNDSVILSNFKQMLERQDSLPSILNDILKSMTSLRISYDSLKANKLREEVNTLNNDGDFSKIGNEWIFNPENTIKNQLVVFKSDFTTNKLVPIKINNDYGYVDKEGIVRLKYFDYASYYFDNYAIVKKGKFWKVIDTLGETITELKSVKYVYSPVNRTIVYISQDNKFHTFSLEYNALAYYTIVNKSVKDTIYGFMKKIIKSSLIDFLQPHENGYILISSKYNLLKRFMWVTSLFNSKYYLVDYYGNILERLYYDKIEYNGSNGLLIIKKKNSWGIYNIKDRAEIVEPTYKYIENTNFPFRIVINKKDEYGIISNDTHSYVIFGDYIIERLENNLLKFKGIRSYNMSKTFITDTQLSCVSGICPKFE